jgi:glyoxylase-like metal-dependent hydrolase (beta-lactamase superfamily II)
MVQQIPVDSATEILGEAGGSFTAVTEDIACLRTSIVNVAFLGRPESGQWILVDAGISGAVDSIRSTAIRRFGKNSRPAAIVLTHGHFDHVGALHELVEEWQVPVYAHTLEHPFLNGTSAYPPPDPTAGGGLMALVSGFYPRGPIDVYDWLQPLAADRAVPELRDWQWVHTPGHTVGHVSFWRERDRALIVGDAFITTAQESAYAVLTQRPELHGPPKYFTPDWLAARDSVRKLAALDPDIVVTGHGPPMKGPRMLEALDQLADHFDEVAVPSSVPN